MDDLRQRARTRTLAIVVVAVLVAIAVAGITIAVFRGQSQAGDAFLPATSSPSASAPRPKRNAGDLNHIVFSSGSDQLSPEAVDQLRELAESTKNATAEVVLSGKIEAASDRAARMDLTKKRINVVRRALQSQGISPGRLRVEIAEYPVGRVPPREADSVEINVR